MHRMQLRAYRFGTDASSPFLLDQLHDFTNRELAMVTLPSITPRQHDLLQLDSLLRSQPGRTPGDDPVLQPGNSLGVVPLYRSRQALRRQTYQRGRLFASPPIQHMRNPKQAANDLPAPFRLRRPTQVPGALV